MPGARTVLTGLVSTILKAAGHNNGLYFKTASYFKSHFNPIPDKVSSSNRTSVMNNLLLLSFHELWGKCKGQVHGSEDTMT
jgi:hypothetical protein